MGSSSRAVRFAVVPSFGQSLRALSVVVMAAVFQPVSAAAGPGGPGTPPAAAEPQAATAGDPVFNFFRKTEVSGVVDAYFHYNFNEPATGAYTPLRNFDVKHNQFTLGLVEVALGKPAAADDRVGFRIDLQYGNTAQIFNADPLDGNAMVGSALINVQQGYVSYLAPAGRGLTFEVGKFVTPIGTEATEAHLNNNYSRSFLYALGPYYHLGARVSYPVSSKVTLTGMVVNGWNAASDNNSGKSFGGGITVAPNSKLTFIQNVLVGPEQNGNPDDWRTYSDTNLAYAATNTVTTGVNYVYAMDKLAGRSVNWQGVALYLKGQITPVFALSPRFEWFNDSDGFATGVSQVLQEFTMTAELKHARGLITRFEFRRDWSDTAYFTKNGRVSEQSTFSVGFVYAFSSKAR